MSSSEDNKEVTTTVKVDEDKFNKLREEVRAELKIATDKFNLDAQELKNAVNSLHELYTKKSEATEKRVIEYIDGTEFKKSLHEYLKSEEAKVKTNLSTENQKILESNVSDLLS